MGTVRQRLLRVIGEIGCEGESNASLAALAERTGLSQFYLQRRFKRIAGESPKRFAQRVRLERAAASLLASEATILAIALDAGFDSHEGFSRAFRRHFGRSPRAFRQERHFDPGPAARHRQVVRSVSPCIRLYRVSLDCEENTTMPTSEIERRMLEEEQPILYIRRRVAPAALQQTMADCFGKLFGHGQAAGLAIAGHPLTRYHSSGPGLWTVDLIMPLAASADGEGEMEAGTLPSGPVAFAVHQGPYDSLKETYAAVERWIEENGFAIGGAPWESYVTDPGEVPDPADWRTEVFWPLQA